MKITHEQLYKIIREERQKLLNEMHDMHMEYGDDDYPYDSGHIHDENCGHDVSDEDDGESEMFKSHLYSMTKQCQELNDMVEEHENIEEWVQEKIAVAAASIDAVYNYLSYQKEGSDYDNDEELEEQSDYVGMDPAGYTEYDYGYGGNQLDDEE